MTEKQQKKLERAENWHKTFIKMALLVAEHSTCCRKQVGCLLVKDRVVISTGYNGVAKGQKHCNEIFSPEMMKKPTFMADHGAFSTRYELHAEQNAIAQVAKNETNPEGAIAYVTLSPCVNCAKLLIASGIKEVYYYEEYDRDTSGIELLKECGVNVRQIKDLD